MNVSHAGHSSPSLFDDVYALYTQLAGAFTPPEPIKLTRNQFEWLKDHFPPPGTSSSLVGSTRPPAVDPSLFGVPIHRVTDPAESTPAIRGWVGWPDVDLAPEDIIERVDRVLGCHQCGGPRGASPSDDFCGEECQHRWAAARTVLAEPAGHVSAVPRSGSVTDIADAMLRQASEHRPRYEWVPVDFTGGPYPVWWNREVERPTDEDITLLRQWAPIPSMLNARIEYENNHLSIGVEGHYYYEWRPPRVTCYATDVHGDEHRIPGVILAEIPRGVAITTESVNHAAEVVLGRMLAAIPHVRMERYR